tara:strand:+ start:422 stop:1663 length:1242 start_codon:yes stop_codon:yes gene_type:complete
MAINILGINHKTTPIDVREKLVFDKKSVSQALNDIRKIKGVNGVVLLSTCNRTEIYTENEKDNSQVLAWLSNQHSQDDISPYVYNHSGENAIKHLFNVTSGIDSMVIGENEILGQVKHAFKVADSEKTINPPLKRLFEYSFYVAKQVRTDTDIGANPVSFMFTAMSLIKKIFSELDSKRATVLGSGHMSQLALKYLQSHGINNIRLTNHSPEKGKKIALENGCVYSKIQYLGNLISTSDIIISSTSSSTPVIGKGLIESCIKTSSSLPIVIIDLGVPRDVEPEIATLDNVFLYSVDDLGKVIKNNFKIREKALKEANKIIDYKINEFKHWLDINESNNLIKSYRTFVDDITHGAVIKAKNQIESGKDIEECLLQLAESLKNKLTHETTSKIKEVLPLLDESTTKKAHDIFKKK